MSPDRGPEADAPSVPHIVITTPSGLVTCAPYLVGFTPTDSLVLVFMTGPPRVVAVTLRIDLICDERAGLVADAIEHLGAALDRALDFGVDVDQTHLLVFSADAADLPSGVMVHDVAMMCADRSIEVGQMLAVHGARMWHYDCPDVGCCPGPGHAVGDAEALRAECELVAAGVGYARDRASLEDSLVPDPERRLPVGDLAAAHADRQAAEVTVPAGQRWRRGCEDSLVSAMRGPYDPHVARRQGGLWAVGLADSRVREPLLYRLLVVGPPARRKARLSQARDWLSGLVRIVPEAACGPVAATLAAVAWQQGDGAFARIAAERALICEPGNRLAMLIHAACGSGLPPRQWMDVLCSFTLTELREPRASGLAAG